ncbi:MULTISPECIES: GNAT family N-acetyltransferase [Lactobacillaceae]|jgi:putative acetyltransferase|uniref:GNAT family N-acetyltransferase n=1 Tax=Lactobacillaceae TaxID=33958 RepID=UPI000978CFD9|nr:MULTISPECIES: GNAT family N-acetyltransferase [Lactobacillaceae]MCG0780235.1 acetyltransferase [Lactiplantibacillus plantarum]MCM8654939.1 GNAT family N-acetyltransferase [Lactiplantibacillus sp. C232]MCT1241530.1 GNAT family N-acetyltransferase [Lactiplantibacillus plantarum]MCT3227165.1 GNAT family N-acetyltransferase [Lactiplantibacillus plantarum]MCT3227361.1 GNAT family N-acetyltransferase [Lactiplantibacillus plantarum]
MITKLNSFSDRDLEQLAQIWLNGNLQAHSFIPAQYWKNQFVNIKKMLPEANIFVYRNNETIVGFLGELDGYIAGLFVDMNYRNQGVGSRLINYLKQINDKLTLSVYVDNINAVNFYENKDFIIDSVGMDTETDSKEYHMIWEK